MSITLYNKTDEDKIKGNPLILPIATCESNVINTDIIYCDSSSLYDTPSNKTIVKELTGSFHHIPAKLFDPENGRFIHLCSGAPGCGKTYYGNQQAEIYHRLLPNNKIYVVNENNESESSYSVPHKRVTMSQIYSLLKKQKMENALVFIDDMITLGLTKPKRDVITETIKNIIFVCRKKRISLLLTCHVIYGNIFERDMRGWFSSIDTFTIFRHYNGMQIPRTLKNFYENPTEVKKDVDELLKTSRAVSISKNAGVQYITSENTIKIY